MKKIILYVLASLLMLFYFVMLAVSFDTSRATDDYRAVYLTDTYPTSRERIRVLMADRPDGKTPQFLIQRDKP